VDLVALIRRELTGQFDPATGHFSGTLVEYMEGEIAYTNCSIGVVDEFKNGEGGSWEADLVNGVVRGCITLVQSGGVPLERATFEAR
jgi:hypothetical protein